MNWRLPSCCDSRFLSLLFSLLFLLLLNGGCSKTTDATDVAVEQSYLRVIDQSGKKRKIIAAELFDADSSESDYQKVFVFDRRENRQVWIEPKRLREPAARDRYRPVTSAN